MKDSDYVLSTEQVKNVLKNSHSLGVHSGLFFKDFNKEVVDERRLAAIKARRVVKKFKRLKNGKVIRIMKEVF